MNIITHKNNQYTVCDNPDVDARIQRDLDFIVSELNALLGPSLRTILLCGGFGRGEGGVYFENGRPCPLNDYDLCVIVHKARQVRKQLGKKVGLLAQRCAKQIGIKQIDIALLSAWQFAIPRGSVVRYEIKHGHKVLYGKLDFPIVSGRAEKIDLYEGARYFFTRAGGLLIARLILDEWPRLPESERGRNCIIELNKAGMAMGDALLILRRLYSVSYRERLKQMEKLQQQRDPDAMRIAEFYIPAVQHKLNPVFGLCTREELDVRWQSLAPVYLQEFLCFEQRRLKRIFCGLEDYSNIVLSSRFGISQKLFRKVKQFVLCRPAGLDEDAMRVAAMALLAGYQDASRLTPALRVLKLPEEALGGLWENAARKYLRQWHPEGIVKELTND